VEDYVPNIPEALQARRKILDYPVARVVKRSADIFPSQFWVAGAMNPKPLERPGSQCAFCLPALRGLLGLGGGLEFDPEAAALA
jgi:hypothetical protein